MAKKNHFIVKQPELGQKILELRKAKGLTQEELVSKCNINVRTIQRIEAGEVTPRSFTVKIILEALGYDLNAIRFEEKDDEVVSLQSGDSSRFLRVSFFVGVIYFILSFVESFVDLKVWGMGFPFPTFHDATSFMSYVCIKASVVITYGVFMLGYYRLATHYPNAIIKTTSLMLAGMTLMALSVDVYSFYWQEPHQYFLFIQAVAFGIIYVVMGIGMTKYRKVFGELAFFGGIVGVLSGLALMTVVLALPGLVMLALFEILQLIVLFRASEENHETRTIQTA